MDSTFHRIKHSIFNGLRGLDAGSIPAASTIFLRPIPEHQPTIISSEAQNAILEAIPENSASGASGGPGGRDRPWLQETRSRDLGFESSPVRGLLVIGKAALAV